MNRLNRREWLLLSGGAAMAQTRRTQVEIKGQEFWINGQPTYKGREWRGLKIQGLLLNTRMVQGIFDDENPETVSRWAYPDTKKWDPERNTREFLAAMPEWKRHGVLCFDICLQGGSPQGYSKEQPWLNSAIAPDGSLKPRYMSRLKRILDRADQLGMVPLLCIFYFGQDEHLNGDDAVRRAVRETAQWLKTQGYRNILLEIANECDNRRYEQPLIKPDRIPELMEEARRVIECPISTSFNGRTVPPDNVVKAADFFLMHGNGVKDPNIIAGMADELRKRPSYRGQPVMINEDDHFDFEKPYAAGSPLPNNFVAAVSRYVSWGYFDPGASNYSDGYQCPPVNWGINTDRKKGFFGLAKEMTGA
jgi:hypothetical protein